MLFLGTSEFALPALALLMYSRWQLVGVVTRPDRPRGRGRKIAPTPVKQFAMEHDLVVFQPASSAELVAMLDAAAIRPAVMVVVAFGQLLKPALLDLPTLGCINIHPSLLPAYRGPAPIQRAIMNGEPNTGVTTMYLSPEMDAGDIILQEVVPVPVDMTYGELSALLAERGAVLLLKTLGLLDQDRAPRQAQDRNKATYAPALTPEEEKIDWEQDATTLFNKIRGMNPNPGAHTLFNKRGLKIWRAQLLDGASHYQPGHICEVNPKSGFTVQTGHGQLLVQEVQPAGRSRMSGAEFTRGYRITPGLLLGG